MQIVRPGILTAFTLLLILPGFAFSQQVETQDDPVTNTTTITTTADNVFGIVSRGAGNMTNATSGTITTGGIGSHGIALTGTGAITNDGSIETSGDFLTAGIFSEGNSEITNTGTISATGNLADGIITEGDGTITNTGTISSGRIGIFSSGDGDITNSTGGAITTTGGSGFIGISSTSAGDITNDGEITSSGQGLRSSGDNVQISNTGQISSGRTGIFSDGADTTITNTGTIASDGVGIFSTGAGTVVTNSANSMITTTREDAHGILSAGMGATVTNDGAITANGDFAHGIITRDDTTTITNTATITTNGDRSAGIFSSGTGDGDITNSTGGTITTSGDFANGIFSTGDGVTITVGETGSITTTGDNAHGIVATGNSEITINSKVSVSGEGSFVVLGGDDTDQTLILLSTAETQGEFNLGESEGDNDIVMVHLDGAASPSTFTIGGAETITLMGMDPNSRMSRLPRLASESGDSVSMLDPTGSSATRIALGAMTGQIRRQVFQRLDATAYSSPPDPVKSLGSWLTAFGRHSERNEDDLVLAWEHSLYGVSGGYDTRLDSGQRVGLLGGFGRDMIETSEVTSIEDSANHAFVGVYGRQPMGRLSLDGSVLLGYANHHGKRLMQGMAGNEIAYGDYNSVYINPSLALGWSRDLGDVLEFRPSVQLSYTYGYYNGYTESGTTNSNISFNSRSVDILDGHLELALARSFSDAQGEIELRGGATFTHYGEDSVGARLGGGALTSYRVPGDETIPGGYAGGALNYKIAGHVTLNGDIEYARASSGTESISGYLGLAWEF